MFLPVLIKSNMTVKKTYMILRKHNGLSKEHKESIHNYIQRLTILSVKICQIYLRKIQRLNLNLKFSFKN